jgi:exonuclease SbcD
VLRLLHFADLHLGVESGGRTDPVTGLNQRIVDVCARLDEVCETVERDGVHLVCFAGDAFKNQHPSPTLQSLFAERIRRMARAGAAVVLVVGNHDLPKMKVHKHPFSIYDALEVDGVVTAERADVYRIGVAGTEVQVAALPHFSKQQVLARLAEEGRDAAELIASELEATVKKLGERTDPSLPSVFVGHCHVTQAKIEHGQRMFDYSDVEVSLSTLTSGQPFPYFALGHIHESQVLSTEPFVAYSGSLERVDYGEGARIEVSREGRVRTKPAEPKGFYRFDLVEESGRWVLGGEPEFRTVDARDFVTAKIPDVDHADPMADVAARIGAVREQMSVDGAFVHVVATLDRSDRGRVPIGAVRELLPEAYDVRLSLDSPEHADRRDPRFANRMSEVEALSSYIEGRDDWAEDRAELLALGRALIAEVVQT